MAGGVTRGEQAGHADPAHSQLVPVRHQSEGAALDSGLYNPHTDHTDHPQLVSPGCSVNPLVPGDDGEPRHLGGQLLVAPRVVPVVVRGQHCRQLHSLLGYSLE